MKIKVTQEDIEKGERTNACRCPISRALTRMGFNNSVATHHLNIFPKGRIMKTIILPKEAKEFIRKFDNYMAVKPFEFELEIN